MKLCSSDNHYTTAQHESIELQNSCTNVNFSEELLGIKIDSNVFMNISHLYDQKLMKICALFRVSKYIYINKRL